LKAAKIELKQEISDIKALVTKGKAKLEDQNEIINTSNTSNQNSLMLLTEITSKWIINITIKINNEVIIETTVLFDTWANLNCIKESLVPTKYFNKTFESLKPALGKKLNVKCKLLEALIIINK